MTRPFLKRFTSDRAGSILMLFGLSILFLVGIAGAGYDLGHQQLVRQKIQQASDAATLAASSMILGSTEAERKAMANRFFQLNYPVSYLGVPRPVPIITVGTNSVTVTADANVATSFVGNFGVDQLAAKGKTTALFKKDYNKIDMILVMDNSQSMGRQDVVGATTATLVESTAAAIRPNCIDWRMRFYSAPPFNLNTPAAAGASCDASFTQNSINDYGTLIWNMPTGTSTYHTFTGPSRINSLRYSARFAANKLFAATTNDNKMAAVTWNDTLMFSQDFTGTNNTIRTFLGKMYPQGATNSTKGMEKAMLMGTAGFRSGAIHAVILFTDGGNNNNDVINPIYGLNNTLWNGQTVDLCNQFKAQGVLVYTIGFGQEVNNPLFPRIKPFLSACATGPNGPPDLVTGIYPNQGVYYFPAASSAELTAAFDQIVGSLQNLKITQ